MRNVTLVLEDGTKFMVSHSVMKHRWLERSFSTQR